MSNILTTALHAGVAGQPGGYQIERSLRFNSADSAYLNRTPASASNRKTWTWSAWVKRTTLDAVATLISAAADSSNRLAFNFSSQNTLNITSVTGGAGTNVFTTTAVYRDVSAWYHIVLAFDTTQATDSNRVKLYVNGTQVTAFSTTNYPSQNSDSYINNNISHQIASNQASTPTYANFYLTEINFIDGSALTPTSFGKYNAFGVWEPKEYTGTYGTNGFYLNFSDNSGTTSSTLGKDQAGSNNWTPNNFSVTAGAGNDSLVDSPTRYGRDTGLGGQVRGNYATLNPLNEYGTLGSMGLSDGGLQSNPGGSNVNKGWKATQGVTSGKWYFEATFTASAADNSGGVGLSGSSSQTFIPGETSDPTGLRYMSFGNWRQNGVASAVVTAINANDVVMVAFDVDASKVWFGKNGTWFLSGDPAAGTNQISSVCPNPAFPVSYHFENNHTIVLNFGQRPFAYTAPSGFKALVTTNLPTPTIRDGSKYFNTVLYSGTGAVQSINVGFRPDWVWIKTRNFSANHFLSDIVRGSNVQLSSSLVDVESVGADTITSFTPGGFNLGANNTGYSVNLSANSYVAWNWTAGGTATTNTSGSITSNVSVSVESGFSIVSYTGNGSSGANVGHGLNAVPAMIIVKNRDQADAWQVYHKNNTAAPETDYLVLNTTAATVDNINRWNDTLPTSTLFTLGNADEVNTNTEKYIAYCFAEVPGYSAFGSYTGNGSATVGPYVYLGFRPRFVMVKRTDSTGNWSITDTSRNPFNSATATVALRPNTGDTESTVGTVYIQPVSNGFYINNNNADTNANAGTYIYAAFSENAFKFSLAR